MKKHFQFLKTSLTYKAIPKIVGMNSEYPYRRVEQPTTIENKQTTSNFNFSQQKLNYNDITNHHKPIFYTNLQSCNTSAQV